MRSFWPAVTAASPSSRARNRYGEAGSATPLPACTADSAAAFSNSRLLSRRGSRRRAFSTGRMSAWPAQVMPMVASPGGRRVDLERQLKHHAKGAQGTDVQLGQVVAGDVLDHAPARLAAGAVGGGDADAEHQVARRAVQQAPRPAGVGGDHAADGGCRGGRRVQRHKLALRPQNALQLLERQARLHRGGHVARLIRQLAPQPLDAQHHVHPLRRRAQSHMAAAAARKYRRVMLVGQAQNVGNLVLIFGQGDETGQHVIHGVGGRGCVRQQIFFAHHGLQGGCQAIKRGHGHPACAAATASWVS